MLLPEGHRLSKLSLGLLGTNFERKEGPGFPGPSADISFELLALLAVTPLTRLVLPLQRPRCRGQRTKYAHYYRNSVRVHPRYSAVPSQLGIQAAVPSVERRP